MIRIKRLFSILFLLLFLTGCDSQKVFEADVSFEKAIWSMNDMPEFDFKIDETEAKDLVFKIRNNLDYPYQNIYFTYYLLNEKGEELASELISIQLFDEVTGKPLGEGNSIYQSSEILLKGYTFDEPGLYHFRLAQYMRTEKLQGVLSLGIRIENLN